MTFDGETNTGLVHRAAAGDQAAWRDLIAEYDPLLHSVTRRFRLSGEQAADVVQTTWLRLIEHIGRLREPRGLPGWLRTTAQHLCIAVVRQQSRYVPYADEPPAVVDGPEVEALRADRRATVRRALARLPQRDRALLSMLAGRATSYQQISRTLDMPVGSIGPTRARALLRLRAELAAGDLVDAALD